MSKKIVAVTACPTGIAHTYMAAEKLEEAAKAKGVEIKVETRGSGGAKNVITKQEIEEATAVIIAADTKVDLNRFSGKHVIQVSVGDGIHKANELIEKAINQDAPIFETNGDGPISGGNRTGVYKHLMNGVSHMLPFVVAGGILIALAFLTDMKHAGDSNYGWGNPFSAFLGDTGKAAFGFMLPILAGYIAYSIADRPGLVAGFVGGALANAPLTSFDFSLWGAKVGTTPSGFLGALAAGFIAGYLVLGIKELFKSLPKSLEGIKPVLLYPLFGVLGISLAMIIVNMFMAPINTGLINFLNNLSGRNAIILGLILGGMMAVDMGGPINKAAYAFGTASLLTASGDSVSSAVMAAVMVGGMTPPLGIAIATSLFPGKFNKQQREAGKGNYVMGLSFITEGAIPFAAASPKQVLPSIIAGSALAGALSMAFDVTSPAPHGGLFVLPVMHGWFWYIIALVAGSILTALLLKVLLPNVEKVEA
jgi:PTS system fructose-specific IIC component